MAPKNERTISASHFRTRCLALLDEVAETGTPLVVTKRGVPVARVVPLAGCEPPDLLGSVTYENEEDLLAPIGEVWDAER